MNDTYMNEKWESLKQEYRRGCDVTVVSETELYLKDRSNTGYQNHYYLLKEESEHFHGLAPDALGCITYQPNNGDGTHAAYYLHFSHETGKEMWIISVQEDATIKFSCYFKEENRIQETYVEGIKQAFIKAIRDHRSIRLPLLMGTNVEDVKGWTR